MDLKTRVEILPCGKCEDMIGCENCLFTKEAKDLYQQIRADVIDLIDRHLWNYSHEVWEDLQPILKQIKEQN